MTALMLHGIGIRIELTKTAKTLCYYVGSETRQNESHRFANNLGGELDSR